MVEFKQKISNVISKIAQRFAMKPIQGRSIKETNEIMRILSIVYFQLLILYVLYVALVTFKITYNQLRLDIFGIMLGLFGCILYSRTGDYSLSDRSLHKSRKIDDGPFSTKKIVTVFWTIVIASILILILSRIWWYTKTTVPLGYDPGLYKAMFDHPFEENWMKQTFPLLFSLGGYATAQIFGSAVLIKWGMVLISILLGVSIFLIIRTEFGMATATISLLVYSLSYTMYKVFWYAYFKNILGMLFLLLALIMLPKNLQGIKRLAFITISALIAGIHQPATLIFGITYICYITYELIPSFITRKTEKRDTIKLLQRRIVDGLAIFAIMLVINYDRITKLFLAPAIDFGNDVISGTAGTGTFFSISTYWAYAFPYMPFAIIGLWQARKNLHLIFPFSITLIIVLGKLFFYNRFIIYLDMFILIFSAIGITIAIRHAFDFSNKKANDNNSKKELTKEYANSQNQKSRPYNLPFLAIILIVFLIALQAVILFQKIPLDKPLISEREFVSINNLGKDGVLNESSIVIVTSSYYAPWIRGYAHDKVIAPGMLDYNEWDRSEWQVFWTDPDKRTLMIRNWSSKQSLNYSIFLYQGIQQHALNLSNPCYEKLNDHLYKFECLQ